MRQKTVIEIGQKIGKRTILAELPPLAKSRRLFTYQCVCGTIGEVRYSNLYNGFGCGCGQGIHRKKAAGVASFNQLLLEYRSSAKRKALPWKLSIKQFKTLTQQPCRYCGKPPASIFKRGNRRFNGYYVYNGIDRKNSQKGYTPSNSVPCCPACNYAKRQMSDKAFADWVTAVYTHFVSDLNKFIDTARQFTAPPSMDTLPSADHAQQVNYGVEMAQRAAQQQPVPPMPPMPPIVPVAN